MTDSTPTTRLPSTTEMSIAEQAAFLRSILESSTEYSIVARDLDGTILAWNEGARRIYGCASEDVVGKASAFILHDPAAVASGRAQDIFDEVRLAGKWEGELLRVREDGGRFTPHVTRTRRHDPAGVPTGITMISRDLLIEPDPVTGPLVTRLFEWYATGKHSLEETTHLASTIGLAAHRTKNAIPRGTMHKLLKSPIYYGEFVWKGRRYRGSGGGSSISYSGTRPGRTASSAPSSGNG